MFLNLWNLSTFDTITMVSTILTVLFIQLINAILVNKIKVKDTKKSKDKDEVDEAVAAAVTCNGDLRRQPSEQIEVQSSLSSPVLTARNSISFHSNGGISNSILHPPSPDALSDEYHEDEDTLSLENLFPCDQTEIYASKKISFIIDELIQTEVNYVNNLRKGLSSYGSLNNKENLPEALQGEQGRQRLLGNIEEIITLHEEQILPMMLRNQKDLKTLFDEFAVHFDQNHFYCYVIFMINKKTSMQLRQEQREWFQAYQTEIKDKLGVDSFLVQPIQRLTRYPLLLQQFISEFYKSGIQCKPVLVSVCKLETRMRRLLQVVNQSEEIPYIEEINELNLLNQGCFRKSTEFDAYHYKSRKKYHVKVFLFDRCLICTEQRKKRITYRQYYNWNSLELHLNNSKTIKIAMRSKEGGFKDEFEYSATEATTVTQWVRCARKIMELERVRAATEGTFSLPMDLVLGVAAAIWLIWNYL